MDWSNEKITTNFNGVLRDAKLLSREELESKYADFIANYSKLYNVAIDSIVSGRVQESIGIFQMMMKARDKMNKGLASSLDTDILVGNELGKKYIYPKTNNPSKDDFKQAIDKIRHKANNPSEEEEEVVMKPDGPQGSVSPKGPQASD